MCVRASCASTSLLSQARPSVITESAPHGPRRDPQEPAALLPGTTAAAHEAKVRLMNEGRSLEGVVSALFHHKPRRHGAEATVELIEELLRRWSGCSCLSE